MLKWPKKNFIVKTKLMTRNAKKKENAYKITTEENTKVCG